MRIWVLADSRTGNTHQAIALAEKLAGEPTLVKLEYNCLAKLPNFLLKYYPIHIKKEILQDIIVKPLPDVIITAGRRTAVLAFYLKMKLNKEIKLVQIMQPSLPYEAFESIILPYHDLGNMPYSSNGALLHGSKKALDVIPWLVHGIQKTIKNTNNFSIFSWTPPWTSHGVTMEKPSHATTPSNGGNDIKHKNILPINGAINNITDKFTSAESELQKYYPKLTEFIAVIIGGNNKKFNFNEKEANLFSSLLKTIYANQKIPFFISFSRRTPETVKSIIKNNMPSSAIIYDPTKDGNYNPYIAMLSKAKYIISTADSISMCSEAASSGKPLYIFCPTNFNSSKHKIFIKQLVEQKIARIFDKSVTMLEEYNYKPLNEAARVAEIIKSKML